MCCSNTTIYILSQKVAEAHLRFRYFYMHKFFYTTIILSFRTTSKSDVEASVAALNAAIANAETAKAYADQKDSELKKDLEGQIGTAKTTLESKIAEAKTEVLNSAKSVLDTAKTKLSTKIATKADASEVNKAIEDLITVISNAESVNNAYADEKNAALKVDLQRVYRIPERR